MLTGSSTSGMVLLCDDQGIIQQIIHNNLGDDPGPLIGRSFIQLVPSPGLDKALNFLVELRTCGAAFDWELNVRLGDEVKSLHFSGVASDNRLLIMAGASKQGLERLYQDLMEINNEQLDAFRIAMKAHSLLTVAQGDRETDYYDELSRLNNKLVNLQRELAKKNAELERLNRQKDQFLGMASHDLRTPLNAIISYSEFLLAETGELLNIEQLEFLSIIRSSSEFMLSLVNDLLDVAAIETGKLELDLQPANLVGLVKSNLVLNKVLAARKKIEQALDSPESLPTILIDSHKIEQVLNNLIGNAVKFSYPNTTVTVGLRQLEGYIQVSVKDNGQGIPAGELDKLFKPFARTSIKSTAGEKNTGLGLMIARKMIERHQGQIWVESKPGQGSTFFFTLPISEVAGATASTETAVQAVEETADKPLRILVAEDSPVNQKVALLLLKKLRLLNGNWSRSNWP